jgi:glycosyltransferase involved in cell wall biosynthesis
MTADAPEQAVDRDAESGALASADAPTHAPAAFLPPDSDATPTLSVVLPTKNEAEGIAASLEAIADAVAELGVTAEVVVSDSSSDRTLEIAREHGAIVVEPDAPGYGYAYRYAFERTRGEYVVMGDADTTYDFRELPTLFERLTDSEADMVIGSRFEGEIRDGAMPRLHRYVGNPALTAFLNRFYDADVSDAHSGFRVLRRAALAELDLTTDGMEFASEMIMAASARGMAVEEVPITYHPRRGEATLDSFRDGWQHLRFMLLNAPGYLFSVPGVVTALLGAVVLLLGFFHLRVPMPVGPSPLFGIRSTVAGSLLLITGYQIASFGVFSTVSADPIRRPSDPVTGWVVAHVSLERGVLVGLGLVLVGGAFASTIVAQWLTAGYEGLPPVSNDILAFTVIVLGIQTVFGAFFLTAIRSNGHG